jgi:zinc/manganese transport system substrate-binding protein
MVTNIRDALIDADPANAATYRTNASSYINELEELDQEIMRLAGTIPEEQRLLVSGHLAFQYFADRYGFTQLGATLGSVTTEGADPSAGEIAALITEIRETGAPAVFAENIANPALAQRIADEAGVVFASPLFSDALDSPGRDAGTYIGMMRHNIRLIVDALAP